MAEEKQHPKEKKQGSFPFFPILKLIIAAYLILLGLNINIPYLNMIPTNIILFVSAGVIILSMKPSKDIKKFKKGLAKQLVK